MARAVAWGVAAAFHNGGVDAHIEKYANPKGDAAEQESVVAEIRGREKPDEWVLVGARLDSWRHFPGIVGDNCNAAMVIEAARDILLTGVRPRRSIRFVLFTGDRQDMRGSWAYVRSHRAELDRARTAIVFGAGCGRMTGYLPNGRHDIEPGVREAMKPIESLGANHYDFSALLGADNFDFVLEGVPTLVAGSCRRRAPTPLDSHDRHSLDKIDIAELKRDTAIAGPGHRIWHRRTRRADWSAPIPG